MQDEVSLREILESVWSGKWIIFIVCLCAVLISGIISYFLLSPTYESTSMIHVQASQDAQGNKIAPDINSIAESIKSDAEINHLIETLKLDRNLYSIQSVRKNVGVEVLTDINVAKLNVRGHNSSVITLIANFLAFELGTSIEMSGRSQEIVNAKQKLIELNDTIAETTSQLNEANKQIAKIPLKIVTQETLVEAPFLLSILKDESKASNKQLGQLQMHKENVNPAYTELQTKIAEISMEMNKQMTTKKNMEKRISENESIITELEQQITQDKLRMTISQPLLNGSNAIFITPAIEDQVAVGPKKILNMALAAIAGIIVSVVIVLFRQYMNNSQLATKTNPDL